jgi:hypothetical protein
MAARWVGLARSKRKKKTCGFRIWRETVRAMGAACALVFAAAINFAMYPEALAAVVAGVEIAGFVPDEPAAANAAAMPSAPVNEEEVRLLAATAWGEARSEGEDGMRAVAHVIVNRVGDRFGDNLETVILAPKQFSAWNIGDPNRPLVQNPERYATGGANLETWEAAQRVAREVLSGQSVDPTEGALFYHTRAIRPWWSRYGEGRTEVGAHVFYRDVPDQRRSRRARVTQISALAPEQRGPRAGRVNGVIQYAPASAARAPLPSETETVDTPVSADTPVDAIAGVAP